ncbi:MAG: stage V sporulation protein AD [Eubacteriaceae bacterium]|nr:stage V sporulation protein AD [Eubacteriaceae bacterium]
MAIKLGSQTYKFDSDIRVISTGSVVGPVEGIGPLRNLYDDIVRDEDISSDSFEKVETNMLLLSYRHAMEKAALSENDIDIFIGGDLLNQIVVTAFAAREIARPYWGIYGACATFGEALQVAACAIESGIAQKAMASSSSHFSTAERQYRTPLEQGVQPSVTAQRTVTGSGCAILSKGGVGPKITAFTIGKVVDFGVKDLADMGSAMAPAAADTILTMFESTRTNFDDYDLVLTGDLATVGHAIASKLLESEGYQHSGNFSDCGILVYEHGKQHIADTGGSGAGSASSVFGAYVFPKLLNRELNKVMLVPTGALMSPVTTYQKESIPSIAHAVVFEND